LWRPWLVEGLASGSLRLYTSNAYKRFFAGVSASLYRAGGVILLTDDELLAATTTAMGGLARRCSEAATAERVVLAWCSSMPAEADVVLAWRRLKGLRRADVSLLDDGSYLVLVEDVGASRIVVTGEGAVEESPFTGMEEEAFRVLWSAYNEYGPFKLRDACRVLEAELGLSRVEARRLVEGLIAKKLMSREPGGYLRPRIRPPL